jgi:hypothetical protein
MGARRPDGLVGQGVPATRGVVGSRARCRRPQTVVKAADVRPRPEPVTGRTRALVPGQRLPGVILPDSTTAPFDEAGRYCKRLCSSYSEGLRAPLAPNQRRRAGSKPAEHQHRQ